MAEVTDIEAIGRSSADRDVEWTTLDEESERPRWLAELRATIVDLWHARELLRALTLRDVRVRYKQAAIGFGWALILPLMVVLAGVMVRYALRHPDATGSGALLGVAAIAVKAIPWSFFVRAVGAATGSLTGNLTLVTKIYFPREVLPLSATLAQAVDTAVAIAGVALALPFLGVRLTTGLLWVPLLLLLLLLLTTAANLFLSCANLFFRDVKHIVHVVLTFGVFFTPVFFEASRLGEKGSRLVMLNPLAPILEGFRLSIVEGWNLLTPHAVTAGGAAVWEPWYLAYSAAWAVGGLIASALLFHRLEHVFAEYA